MLKKFITYILTVCMVCSLACSIPFTADAADPVQYSTIIVEQNPKPMVVWDMSAMSSADGVTYDDGDAYITTVPGTEGVLWQGQGLSFNGTKAIYSTGATNASVSKTFDIELTTSNGILFSGNGKYTIEIPLKIYHNADNPRNDRYNTGQGITFSAKSSVSPVDGSYVGFMYLDETMYSCLSEDGSYTTNQTYWATNTKYNTDWILTVEFDNSGDTTIVTYYMNNTSPMKVQTLSSKVNTVDKFSIHAWALRENSTKTTSVEFGNISLWRNTKDNKPVSFKDVEWNIIGDNLVFSGAPSTSYNIKAKNSGSSAEVYTGSITTDSSGKADLSLGGLSSDNVSNPGEYLVYLSDSEYEGVANAGISLYVGAEAMLNSVDTYIGSAASAEDKSIFKKCFMKNASIDADEAQAVMDMYTALDSESKTYVAENTSVQKGFAEFSKLVKLTSLWGGALPDIPADTSANSIIKVSEAGSVKPSYWDVSSFDGAESEEKNMAAAGKPAYYRYTLTSGDFITESHYSDTAAAPEISFSGDDIVYTAKAENSGPITFTATGNKLIDRTKDCVYTFKIPVSANGDITLDYGWIDGSHVWSGDNSGTFAYNRSSGSVSISGDSSVNSVYMQFTSAAGGNLNVTAYLNDSQISTKDEAYITTNSAGVVSRLRFLINGAAAGTKVNFGDIKFWSGTKSQEPSDDSLSCSFDSESGKLTIDGEAGEAYLIRVLKPVGISGIDAFTSVYDENTYEGVKTLTDICGYELTSSIDEHREYSLPVLNPGMYKLDVFKPGFGTPIYSTVIYNKINSILAPSDIMENITDTDFADVYTNAGYTADEAAEIQTAASSVSDGSALSSMTELNISKLYAAVLARSLVENKSSDDASVNSVLSKLSDLGIDTTAFELLKANNDRAVVMDGIYAVNPTTFTELVTELKSIAVLNGVKNALVDSEAQTFISTIGNTKYDGADSVGKLTIAGAVRGKTYANISALSNAMNNVTLTSGGTSGTNNAATDNDYSGGKLNTGSSGGGTPIPVIPIIPQGSTYSDVPDSHWASDYIEEMTKQGIVSGYDGKFNPDNTITRAEYLKMLCSIFKINNADSTTFEDVLLTDWFAPYVGGAEKAGLVKGTGTGFDPNGNITRQDAAVMLTRFMKYAGIELDAVSDLSYSDAGDISDYANEAIQILTGMGILNGVGDGRVAPLDLMTRAQAAKMLFFAID